MKKIHKKEVAPVEMENERDENYQADNPQIDSARTHDNYHIIDREESYTEYINQRIKSLDLPTAVRKDAVLFNSFVIGSDGDFFKSLSKTEEKEFFKDCVQFFADTYGEENILSAIVHKDETNPHMHLNLVPITKNGRLSSKILFDRKLDKLQTDFHRAVGPKYGLERGKEGSHRKHLDTAEYKAQQIKLQALIEKDELENQNDEARKTLAEVRKETAAVQSECDKLIAERNVEADYSKALSDAKSGNIAHGKKELTAQVVALTAENTSLTKRLDRSMGETLEYAKRADALQREKEVNSHYVRVGKELERSNKKEYDRITYGKPKTIGNFFDSVLSLFTPEVVRQAPRLQQIEEELEEERKRQEKQNKNDNYNY